MLKLLKLLLKINNSLYNNSNSLFIFFLFIVLIANIFSDPFLNFAVLIVPNFPYPK